MADDVTTLSQVSAIPQSAHAPGHVGITPTSQREGVTYYSQGVETVGPDARQQSIQTQSTSPLPSARDISDNWAYTSHTPRSPRVKSPSQKTPRGKSPRAKTPQDMATPKSALVTGNNNKGKGKKVQIKEDNRKNSKGRQK